jgi:hypothetical protein
MLGKVPYKVLYPAVSWRCACVTRVVGENQDEFKWPLYRRRTLQRCYDSRQQQSTEIYKCYLLLQNDTTFLKARHTVRNVPGASSYDRLPAGDNKATATIQNR